MLKVFTRPAMRWLLVLLPLAVIAFFVLKQDEDPVPPPAPDARSPALAELGMAPEWSGLDRFQEILSRETFRHRLETIYTKGDSWKKWITIDEADNRAWIGDYELAFSPRDEAAPGAIWSWKTRKDLAPDRELPLSGLKIALDPGHIGGDYARIEEREHQWGETLIQEGTMTLRTAEILAPLLEDLGAKVTLVRSRLEPVTGREADDFADPRLFYRTSEIRARARLVNETIQPDLVLCLHYNGTASPFPETSQHFHLILNGTYTEEELSHEDERFQMLQRLLSGTIEEEIPLAREIAGAFADQVRLAPYEYPANSATSQRVANHPYLWARNLLANRLYQCPVIFLEPYVMNSIPFIREYRDNPDQVYQEYARAVAEGLTRYYSRS